MMLEEPLIVQRTLNSDPNTNILMTVNYQTSVVASESVILKMARGIMICSHEETAGGGGTQLCILKRKTLI